MYNNKSILALIPARGGSKGLKNKNIKLLNGKELIGYSIEFAKTMKFIDSILVSSDSPDILRISKDFGANILHRPDDLSLDTTKMSEVVKHAMEAYHNSFDFVVLLQPTSPIRSLADISHSIKLFVDLANEYDSLMPLCETSNKNGIIVDNKYIQNNKGEHNRQEMDSLYMECGAVFVYKKDLILSDDLIGKKIFPHIVKRKIETFDIDTEEDFLMNELILQNIFGSNG